MDIIWLATEQQTPAGAPQQEIQDVGFAQGYSEGSCAPANIWVIMGSSIAFKESTVLDEEETTVPSDAVAVDLE